MSTATVSRRRKSTSPPDQPPIDDQPGDGDGHGDGDNVVSWPDTKPLREKLPKGRPPLCCNDQLPFAELRLKLRPTDATKEAAAAYAEHVAQLKASHAGCVTTFPQLTADDFLTGTVEEMDAHRGVRQQEMLNSLRECFRACDRAVQLAENVAAAWKAEGVDIASREEAVKSSTNEAFDLIFPDEPEHLRRGRVNASPALVAFRQELSEASVQLGVAKREAGRFAELRLSIALEIELFIESLIQ